MGKKLWFTKITISLVLLFFQLQLAGQVDSVTPSGGDLRIYFQGLRNNRGVVLLSIFSTATGYPADVNKAFLKYRIIVKQLQLPFIIKNLKPGNYAIALLHDEDENGKMLTSMFGLPKEGYGFSNNVMGLTGPPSFHKASFSVPSNGTTITIKVKY
ncbi:MAG: hypothetical protein RL555_1270 [Bacteroidota bacterium]|jgi:uncharacterized protein (DUF2141 family)